MAAAKVTEISQGVFLHKLQIKQGDDLFYIFKLEVKRMNMVEFIADFGGSENIVLDGKMGLIVQQTIEPFVINQVAKLVLKRDWKLKSKFKVLLKAPPMHVQEKYLTPYTDELTRTIINNTAIVDKHPISVMSLAQIQQILISSSINFIDSEFLPTDDSVFSDNVDTSNFETLVHWRRPKDFMEVDYSQDLRDPAVFYDSIDPSDIRQGIRFLF